ncbi:alpha/beta hydrolase [Peribacillus asahii]|uniref:alpha/beta hydrolase n=1 Tax=Peribacillus asahii TaxID=228899 RepID=UPI00207A9382|nr:carboxylesterase [Peribacillus asahii]USK61524.1 carboxylesterase [Peribacillus asahii]
MKVVTPKPFMYKGGERAVLLLHGFTGNTVDVKRLGKYLNDRGYTCYAPLYKGHGLTPEELIETNVEDWWQSVVEGYQFLKSQGYEQIAAVGLSLGGVFSLKLAYSFSVSGVVTMCSPMYQKKDEAMQKRVIDYAYNYKKFEGKSEETIEAEMAEFQKVPMNNILTIRDFILDVQENLDQVFAPLFVAQGRLDHTINLESVNNIYNGVNSYEKELKWYEESGHIITLGPEREQLYEDIYEFLELL